VSNRSLAAAALFAAVVVTIPTRAFAGSPGTTTTTSSNSPRATVESRFPAAGGLVVNAVAVRKSPDIHSHVIKVMHQFRSDFRPQEMFAVREKTGTDGQPWYKVSIPMRPNGTYGWVHASTVSLSPTHSRIVVNVRRRTIDVYRFGKRRWHGIVAVGAPGRETPLGHYYVAARFVPYHDPFLGVFAEETSAYSKLTEWPGGGVVGIHGTDEPWLLGKAVSHGCVRVSNHTASKLKRLAPLGTPILIKK
jgi:lipoprotein-anchoring transpeptidase ErfK/SrfK